MLNVEIQHLHEFTGFKINNNPSMPRRGRFRRAKMQTIRVFIITLIAMSSLIYGPRDATLLKVANIGSSMFLCSEPIRGEWENPTRLRSPATDPGRALPLYKSGSETRDKPRSAAGGFGPIEQMGPSFHTLSSSSVRQCCHPTL